LDFCRDHRGRRPRRHALYRRHELGAARRFRLNSALRAFLPMTAVDRRWQDAD
jgi:hypothetical protein